jgi:hypothetical protein
VVARHRKAVELGENGLDPHDPELAALHTNLGVACRYAALFDDAEMAYRRALDLADRRPLMRHFSLRSTTTSAGLSMRVGGTRLANPMLDGQSRSGASFWGEHTRR